MIMRMMRSRLVVIIFSASCCLLPVATPFTAGTAEDPGNDFVASGIRRLRPRQLGQDISVLSSPGGSIPMRALMANKVVVGSGRQLSKQELLSLNQQMMMHGPITANPKAVERFNKHYQLRTVAGIPRIKPLEGNSFGDISSDPLKRGVLGSRSMTRLDREGGGSEVHAALAGASKHLQRSPVVSNLASPFAAASGEDRKNGIGGSGPRILDGMTGGVLNPRDSVGASLDYGQAGEAGLFNQLLTGGGQMRF